MWLWVLPCPMVIRLRVQILFGHTGVFYLFYFVISSVRSCKEPIWASPYNETVVCLGFKVLSFPLQRNCRGLLMYRFLLQGLVHKICIWATLCAKCPSQCICTSFEVENSDYFYGVRGPKLNIHLFFIYKIMTRLNNWRVFLSDKLFDKAMFVDAFNSLECFSCIAAIMMHVVADMLLKLNAF